ncbi:hypothetical protein H2248_010211 [Termitomyces sp. 'cryptogamus']|nr:hypothetical protein H2248_010211 [Termitomyces sp. 'cryptogamus']
MTGATPNPRAMIAEVIWRTPQFSGDLRGSRKSPRDVEQAAEVLEQVAEVRNRSPLTPPPLNPGQFPPAQKPQSQNGANHCMHPPAPQPSNMDRETLDKSEQMYGMAPEHDTYSNGVDPYIQGPNEQHTYRLGLADEESYFDQTSGGEYNVNMFELYSAHPSHSGYMQYENPLIPAHYDTPYIQNATCPPQFLQVPPNRYCHGQQYHLQEDNHAPHGMHTLPVYRQYAQPHPAQPWPMQPHPMQPCPMQPRPVQPCPAQARFVQACPATHPAQARPMQPRCHISDGGPSRLPAQLTMIAPRCQASAGSLGGLDCARWDPGSKKEPVSTPLVTFRPLSVCTGNTPKCPSRSTYRPASGDSNTISTGKSLHTTSTIIFLVLSVLVVYQALIVAKNELRYSHLLPGIPTASFGSSSGSLLLLEDESIPRSPSPENWDADPAFIEDSTDPDIRRLNELRKRSFTVGGTKSKEEEERGREIGAMLRLKMVQEKERERKRLRAEGVEIEEEREQERVVEKKGMVSCMEQLVVKMLLRRNDTYRFLANRKTPLTFKFYKSSPLVRHNDFVDMDVNDGHEYENESLNPPWTDDSKYNSGPRTLSTFSSQSSMSSF